MFQGTDFFPHAPLPPSRQPARLYQAAREELQSGTVRFHESMTKQGGKLYTIIADVCAFANTNGGTIYVGLNSDPKKMPVGIPDPQDRWACTAKSVADFAIAELRN